MTNTVVETIPTQGSSRPLTQGYWYDAELHLSQAPASELIRMQNLINPPKPAPINRSSFAVTCKELGSDAPNIESARFVPVGHTIKSPILIIHGLMVACEVSVYCDDLSTPSGICVINGVSSSTVIRLTRTSKSFSEGDTFKLHLKLAA
ncbi:MAG: hypothetical protein ABIS59_02250 [Candidatus Saccharibacteria bacterium]